MPSRPHDPPFLAGLPMPHAEADLVLACSLCSGFGNGSSTPGRRGVCRTPDWPVGMVSGQHPTVGGGGSLLPTRTGEAHREKKFAAGLADPGPFWSWA